MLPASFSPELSIFTTHGLSNSVKSTYTGKKIDKSETRLLAHVANLPESTDISKFKSKLGESQKIPIFRVFQRVRNAARDASLLKHQNQ